MCLTLTFKEDLLNKEGKITKENLFIKHQKLNNNNSYSMSYTMKYKKTMEKNYNAEKRIRK